VSVLLGLHVPQPKQVVEGERARRSGNALGPSLTPRRTPPRG
jgi:hypothetical protein